MSNPALKLWRRLFWRWLCLACQRVAIRHVFCRRCRQDANRWAKLAD